VRRPGSLLLLVPTRSYREADFLAAADRLGVDVLVGSDLCHTVEERIGGPANLVSLDYRRPERAAEQVAEVSRERPIAGVVPADDGTAVLAALCAERLDLPRNPPDAARRAGAKHLQRAALRDAGVPVPPFALHAVAAGPEAAAAASPFPCVLKPVGLSGSRGVIRADDVPSFVAAFRRIEALLQRTRAERKAQPEGAREAILVEGFVPGPEVAVEALLRGGRLEVLAIFDKPDPLDGPFFEETLYVTPSRHAPPLQRAAADVVARGCAALGLVEGPIHAELRLDRSGGPEGSPRPIVLEIAARSIGGLCSRTLRFGAGVSLEELVVAHAVGLPLDGLAREARAAGVLMLPIPRAGILRGVSGLEAARAVPLVEDVVITIPNGREVLPLPEGDAYLGFAFARGGEPAAVEAALRAAHARLAFDILPQLPTV
jgi:biotin carboxylase